MLRVAGVSCSFRSINIEFEDHLDEAEPRHPREIAGDHGIDKR